jgi:site-specific recombinase XerD
VQDNTFISIITVFIGYLLTHKRASRNTVDAYQRDLQQCAAVIGGDRQITTITADDIRLFLQKLHDDQISARSIARKISALKAFYAYVHEQYGIESILQSFVLPKIEKKLPHYLNEEQIEQLLAVVDSDTTTIGRRNQLIIYLLYSTGMRISELLALTVHDIHLDTGLLRIHGKGGKQRLLPLTTPVQALLSAYVSSVLPQLIHPEKHSETTPLFCVWYGKVIKPLTRQACWGILKELCVRANISQSVSPHMLRHSLATHLLKRGVNLRALQMLLGHEQLQTVQVYTHVETSYLRTIYDKKHPRSQ